MFKKVVAVTGCDSGLGWAIAARIAREGIVTVAGMYHGTETKAAEALKNLAAHTFPLDVTKADSVHEFRNYVNYIVNDRPENELYAIVNNAGVMTIADYEWQTPSIIENTINVNLLGAMRVVSAFLPDLRRNALKGSIKPRIINVASHCGLQPMPGFAPYCASKAGLLAWTYALRMEHRKHGLNVVAFVPGGFIGSSNLLLQQTTQGKEMLEHFDEEQKLFYEKRINALIEYLSATSQDLGYDSLKDVKIMDKFINALNDNDPRALYKVESCRYRLYYTLMKLPLPESVNHWIIKKFLNFPDV